MKAETREVLPKSCLSLDNDNKRIITIPTHCGNAVLARGTFGEISIALDTGLKSERLCRLAAVKTLYVAAVEPNKLSTEVFDELTALRLLNPHPCIVPLLAVFENQGSHHSQLSLAFPYSPIDLHEVLERRRKLALPPYPIPVVKRIISDILLGVQHCHEHGVVHCDLKPGNMLISTEGRIQLCDFGLAKPCPRIVDGDTATLDSGKEYRASSTKGLCTLQYRPPEILLGGSFRDPSGDIYCVGLIFAELLLMSPLFNGNTVLDQLGRTFEVLGTPHDGHWPDARDLPDYGKMAYLPTPPQPWAHIVPCTCEYPMLSSFLSSMVALDPKKRSSASSCLEHEWFSTLPRPISSKQLADRLIPIELDPPRVLFADLGEKRYENACKRAVDIARARRASAYSLTSSSIEVSSEQTTLRGRYEVIEGKGKLVAALSNSNMFRTNK